MQKTNRSLFGQVLKQVETINHIVFSRPLELVESQCIVLLYECQASAMTNLHVFGGEIETRQVPVSKLTQESQEHPLAAANVEDG